MEGIYLHVSGGKFDNMSEGNGFVLFLAQGWNDLFDLWLCPCLEESPPSLTVEFNKKTRKWHPDQHSKWTLIVWEKKEHP